MSNSRSNVMACFLVVILLVVNFLSAQFSGGNGYPDNPWQIKTEQDIFAINGYMGANFIDEPYMNFKLMNDITINNIAVLPLGAIDNPFFGKFDGNGFTITINGGCSSLFAHLQPQAMVKDLSVHASGASGLIAVCNMGTITDCIVFGILSGGDQVGAVANSNDGTIINCNSHCVSVSGSSQVGGIAGLNDGEIINCKNYADVTSTGSYLGGIAGQNGGSITKSYNHGQINANSSEAGGIAGKSDGNITKSLNAGNIVTTANIANIGGIAGWSSGSISEVGNTGNLIGAMFQAGGVTGMNEGTLVNSYFNGVVSGTAVPSGGIVGYQVGNITISNSFWNSTLNPSPAIANGLGLAKSSVELNNQSTYTNWDFTTTPIWHIVANENNGFPHLAWQQLTPLEVEESQMPFSTTLLNNYPNPFNPKTAINYELRIADKVKLTIFNAKGELVKTLVNGMQNAGRHSVNFDGAGFNSGVYFYKLEADGKNMVKRMMMVK